MIFQKWSKIFLALATKSSVAATKKAKAMLIPPRMLMSFLAMKLPPFCD